MRRFLQFFLIVTLASCGYGRAPGVQEAGELIVLTREGPTTYTLDEDRGPVGFDHDLAQLFAQELGVQARFIVADSDAEIYQQLKKGKAHLAAASLVPVDDPALQSGQAYFQSTNFVVTHEASLPINDVEHLAGKTIHVIAGSRQAAALHALQGTMATLQIVEETRRGELGLLEDVEAQRVDAAFVDEAVFDIGSNYFPALQASVDIGEASPVAWLFPRNGSDPELLNKANAFLSRVLKDGTVARLKDRYFGHIERLTQTDAITLIERIRTVLPKYRSLFQAAQASTGIDWRLLAALAYQESQWDPLATSPTGVRGMMMLTEETANRLGVANRLDPKQCIRAGAQYLAALRDGLPPGIKEPDRLWLALAAYNLGMGHLQGARAIARSLKVNPDSWYEMKRVLPLLSRPEYYVRLKSGIARGGEAVTLVENIRMFADILTRYEIPHRPLREMGRMTAVEAFTSVFEPVTGESVNASPKIQDAAMRSSPRR
jgi:membrane-bound lytic murein transglycosylase F